MSEPAIKKQVTITREFDAPRDLVFAAWTEPEHVKQWWGPHYFTVDHAEIDPRPGGAFEIVMVGLDGTRYPSKGSFREFTPPERLIIISGAVYDEDDIPALEVRQTVTFEEIGSGRTRLTLHAEVIRATDAASGAVAGMEQGWQETIERLGMYLSGIDG